MRQNSLASTFGAALVTALGLAATHAGNVYWDGTGAGWDAPANWSTTSGATTPDPAAAPGAADGALFNITTVNSAQTVNLMGNQSALGLTFNSTGTTLLQGGGANRILTLGTSGITVGASAGAVTLGGGANQGVGITLGGHQSWMVNSGRQLTANGAITGAYTLNTLGTGTLTLNGAGTSVATLNATRGTLVLAGSSTTTAGSVAVTESGIGGNGAAELKVQDSALLNVSGAFLVGNRNNLANIGTITQTGGTVNLSSTSTDVRLGHWTSAKGIYTISGGTLNVLNAVTYVGWDSTGVLNVDGGTVNVKGLNMGSRTGSNTANTQVNLSGGILNVGSSGIAKNANPVINLNSGTLGALTGWSSSANMTLGASVNVDTTGGDITLTGIISGVGGFTKVGTGTLSLSGPDTYAGGTTIRNGTLALTGAGSIANSTLILLEGGGSLDVSGSTNAAALRIDGTLQLAGRDSTATLVTASGKDVALAAAAPLSFSAFKPVGAGGAVPLALSGAGALIPGSNSPVTVTVANDGVQLTPADSPFKLIAKGNGPGVASIPGGALVIDGDGASGTPSLSLVNGELYLVLTGPGLPTTTALALSSGNPVYGEDLTFTATLYHDGQIATNAAGSFTFKLDGVAVATVPILNGQATYTVGGLTLGDHDIEAIYPYNETAFYGPSSGTLVQSVGLRPLTVSGMRVYDGTADAAGVILTLGNVLPGDDLNLASGVAVLAGADAGTQMIASPGTLTLGGTDAAHYTLQGLAGQVTINKAPVNVSLASSASPAGFGMPVTFAATVQRAGQTTPTATGAVSFSVDGGGIGTGTLAGGIAYSPVQSSLGSGTHTVAATYPGDANHEAGAASLSQQVLAPQTEAVTFANAAAGTVLAIGTNGAVSLKRNGQQVSTSGSKGWSVYNWFTGARTMLDKMAETSPGELLLWSSNGQYRVNVAITANDRYVKFELRHVSNNPQTGQLDNDWPGHRVEFDVRTSAQGDGWKLKTIPLNPMVELSTRWPYKVENGAAFSWPYPQWAQTTDRPQPQGAVAVFGFVSDTEHDDILTDIWVAEPSLPRPNTKNVASPFQTWTRADVTAWLDRWEQEQAAPMRQLSLYPEAQLANLYTAADYCYAAGLNAIYLSQHDWQGDNIRDFNSDLFPNGRTDALAWKQYCDARGIRLNFHGFSHLIRKADPNYGPGVVPDGLARSARGVLLQNVPANATGLTILVQPDLDYFLGMKEGMMPYYDINSLTPPKDFNGGLGGTFPPYYENMGSYIKINKSLYTYTASLTAGNQWQIVVGTQVSGSAVSSAQAGDTAEFILSTGNYYLPDSRSQLLVDQAIGYAQLLNDMQTTAGYDGSAWTEDLGSWGLRRFSQEVVERMDHPAGGDSAFGIRLFGHFEYQFKRVQNLDKEVVNIPVYLAEEAAPAPGMDEMCYGASKGAGSRHIGLRSIHSGLTMDAIQNYGLMEEAGAMLKLWSKLKPHLTAQQVAAISSAPDAFHAVSETASQWQLTKTLIMRREGIDSTWNVQPERPNVPPCQFLKADSGLLAGLNNPYATQAPVVELRVMAGMSATNAANISLMPANAGQIINPVNAVQTLGYTSGKLTAAYDNSGSGNEYKYYTKSDTVGYWSKTVDMSGSRGLAITVNGDNSGSTLVVSTGTSFPRCYAIKVDFTGQRTIEIPNGEAVNNLAGWDIFSGGTVTQFDYAADVDRFRVWLHKVPAGVNASVEILNIQAMNEDRTTGLVNPVLTINGDSVTVNGTIPYDHYLTYPGSGSTAKVYDPNWNFVTNLTVGGAGLTAAAGNNTFSVNASGSTNTWVSSRIKVADAANAIGIAKPNAVPVFTADPFSTANATEDSAYTGSLSGSATDEDGDTLTYSKVSGPAWLNVAADGSLSGAPANDDVGANSFTVSASDGIAPAVTATLNISVINANDAPVWTVNPINGSDATQGMVYSGNLAGVASDVDAGAVLAFAKAGGPAWLNVAPDGTVSGMPGNSDVGANSFTVSVSDGIAAPVTATLNISVINVNDAPFWTGNPFSMPDATEDAAYTGTLAGSASDMDLGSTLTFAKVSGPAWLGVAANGTLSGTPTNSDVGANSFTVSVSDGIAAPVTVSLNITVINTNDAPTWASNPVNGADATEDSAYSGNLAANATDVDQGATLTFAKVSGPAWLTVGANGALSGTPANSDVGANSFTVSVSDGIATPVNTTLNITVINTNDAPTWSANPIAGANATEDATYTGTLAGSASDVDLGATLTFAKVSGPAWLTVGANGALSGTPANSDVGANSFTVSVSDGIATPVNTTLNITVINTNDAPTWSANPIAGANATEDAAYSGSLASRATDVDAGATLTFTKISGPTWLSVAANGTLSGTPANSDVGANSFTVSVSDGIATPVNTTLNITVINTNDAPVWTNNPVVAAGASGGVVYVGQTLAGQATDADVGDTITYSKVSGPAWLIVASDGTLSGTPPSGSAGLNSFVVRATDTASATADTTLQITVAGLPLPWVSADIGTGMLAGSATYNAGTFTQAGSGIIGSTSDKLRFTYQTLSGDGEIIAKISSLQNTGNSARVGVMIRDTLAANSKEIFMGMTGSNAYRWDRRTSTGGSTSSTNNSTGTVPNTWVRLVRSGTTITAYKSTNGTSWTSVGSTTNTTFGTTCYIGLAVGSGSDTTLNTSQFSNLSVTP